MLWKIILLILILIFLFSMGYSNIISFLSIPLNSFLSFFLGIFAYAFKYWISYRKSYRQALLKCKWTIQQNQAILELQKTTILDKKSIIDKLELVPPYLEHYSALIDNSIRNSLILYNAQITKLKIHPNENKLLISDIDIYQSNALQAVDGEITLVNKLLKNPLLFFILPYTVRWVENKFFKSNINKK